ncbi:MAG: altronate dehydrogenase [Candidatus Latescibacterota bacterium]|nr:altronate dehydrogenase [Candidatus Latescibacterota bacterium]
MRPDGETILQFGGGNFLRAFVDVFLHDANVEGQEVGLAVVITSTDSPRAQQINASRGAYHVHCRGRLEGVEVDETRRYDRGLARALPAASDWPEVLRLARSPDLRLVVSNTTEAGFILDDADGHSDVARTALGAAASLLPGAPPSPQSATPASFPAKLLAVLAARYHSGLPALTVVPCELYEENGDRLRKLVLEQARRWGLSGDLLEWIRNQCLWPNTLVDRIVSGRPKSHPLLSEDSLLVVAEPYAFWAIENRPDLELFRHQHLRLVDNVAPFSLRKVRVLNGIHTALVCRALPLGIETVAEALEHSEVGPWLRQLLDEEILPVLKGRVPDLEEFVRSGLERFGNPHLHHRLADIAIHHETKLQTRLVPTAREFEERFGRKPPLLSRLL